MSQLQLSWTELSLNVHFSFHHTPPPKKKCAKLCHTKQNHNRSSFKSLQFISWTLASRNLKYNYQIFHTHLNLAFIFVQNTLKPVLLLIKIKITLNKFFNLLHIYPPVSIILLELDTNRPAIFLPNIWLDGVWTIHKKNHWSWIPSSSPILVYILVH